MKATLVDAVHFLSSQALCNALMVVLIALTVSVHTNQSKILESLKRQEPVPMSSTHTVTVGNESFPFTITTPWRENDTGASLAQRHWENVAQAKEKIYELMGGS